MNKFEKAATQDKGLYVTLSYSLTRHMSEEEDFDLEFDKLAKQYRGELAGTGAGFGGRDLSFMFLTNEEAVKFIGRALTYSKRNKLKINIDKEPLKDYYLADE